MKPTTLKHVNITVTTTLQSIKDLTRVSDFVFDKYTYEDDEKEHCDKACLVHSIGNVEITYWVHNISQADRKDLINKYGFR